MNKFAIYPGTFDPITYGHIDVIKKALKLFDKIIVSVSDVSNKNYLFNSDERIKIVNKALFSDLKMNKNKIKIDIIADNTLIIPEYIIDLQNKTKKTIETIKYIEKLKNLENQKNEVRSFDSIVKKKPYKKKTFHKKKFYKKAV